MTERKSRMGFLSTWKFVRQLIRSIWYSLNQSSINFFGSSSTEISASNSGGWMCNAVLYCPHSKLLNWSCIPCYSQMYLSQDLPEIPLYLPTYLKLVLKRVWGMKLGKSPTNIPISMLRIHSCEFFIKRRKRFEQIRIYNEQYHTLAMVLLQWG